MHQLEVIYCFLPCVDFSSSIIFRARLVWGWASVLSEKLLKRIECLLFVIFFLSYVWHCGTVCCWMVYFRYVNKQIQSLHSTHNFSDTEKPHFVRIFVGMPIVGVILDRFYRCNVMLSVLLQCDIIWITSFSISISIEFQSKWLSEADNVNSIQQW